MLKVLIVDDEANICLLIKNLIDWQGLGLEYIGDAHNGHSALAAIHNDKPDIVITDIKMPGMDGMELVKAASALYGNAISFIIISGYKSFDYAYEAIKYGVVDFLLKPINRTELNATLTRLLLMMQGESDIETKSTPERDQIIRKQFLINLLYVDVRGKTVADINRDYRYHFQAGIFLPCMLYIGHFAKLGKIKDSVMAQLIALLSTQLGSLCYDIALHSTGQKIWMVLNYNPAQQDQIDLTLQALVVQMRDAVRAYQFLEITLGIGSAGDLDTLVDRVHSADEAVLARVVVGGGQCIRYDAFQQEVSDDVAKRASELDNAMKKAQELRDETAMLKACDAYIALLGKQTMAPYFATSVFIRNFRLAILETIRTHAKYLLQEYEKNSELFKFDDCADLSEMRERIHAIVLEVADRINETKETQDTKILKAIKDYVAENYQQQITLDDVAKQVYLSASYFGVFFKKETGELFSQYLTRVRMDKAKELLKDYNFSIKEIANKVGYKDLRNFSKLFKAQVGITPTEFRKLYRLDTEG